MSKFRFHWAFLLVAAVVLHAVWCMSSSSTASDCPACVGAAYVAAGVVAVFVGVWAVSEFAR